MSDRMNDDSILQSMYKECAIEELQNLKDAIDKALESDLGDRDAACEAMSAVSHRSDCCVRSLTQFRLVTAHNL